MQTDRGTKFIWKTSRRAVATAAATTIVLSACRIHWNHSVSSSRATATAMGAAEQQQQQSNSNSNGSSRATATAMAAASATISVVARATLVAATA